MVLKERRRSLFLPLRQRPEFLGLRRRLRAFGLSKRTFRARFRCLPDSCGSSQSAGSGSYYSFRGGQREGGARGRKWAWTRGMLMPLLYRPTPGDPRVLGTDNPSELYIAFGFAFFKGEKNGSRQLLIETHSFWQKSALCIPVWKNS